MLFTNLSSHIIKSGLVSRYAFSLGFKLIAAALQAKRPQQLDFETGAVDYTPQDNLKQAKRNWAIFKEFAETHNFPHSELAEIAEAYAKSTNKPVVTASSDMVALRARISGLSTTSLQAAENKQRDIAVARQRETLQALICELDNLTLYTNEWFQTGQDEDTDHTMEEDDILPDAWVNDTYPKILKSQVAFWTKYNNWDDAEVCLIAADQELLK